MWPQTSGLDYKVGVALMSWTFPNHNSAGAESKEASRGGAHQDRVCVHRAGQVFNEIRFEKNRFLGHVQMEQSQAIKEKVLDGLRLFHLNVSKKSILLKPNL